MAALFYVNGIEYSKLNCRKSNLKPILQIPKQVRNDILLYSAYLFGMTVSLCYRHCLFHVEQNSPQIIHRAKNSEKFKQIHKFL